jgi:hypothetical protein
MSRLLDSSSARQGLALTSRLAGTACPRRWPLHRWMVVLLVVVVAGCGSNPRPVPVSGLVTIQGDPLRWGVILLDPIDGGPPAVGEIQTDGTFRLTSFREFDGAIPGTYRVSFIVYPMDGPPALYGRTGTRAKTKSDFLPVKYTDPQKSGLQVIINERDNHLELHLTD